jgi:hypothetical protein
MGNPEALKLVGRAKMTLFDYRGEIKDIREFFNLITNAGFDAVCAVLGNPTQPNNFDYIAIGTGTTGALVTDTALEKENARGLGTYAHTGGTKVFTVTQTFSAGTGTGSITESGVLNADGAGTLLCRQVFSSISKGAADSLQVQWQFTLS